MAFTKINAAGIGTTETVTVDGLTVINDGSFGGNLTVAGVLTYEDVTNVDSVGLITARNGIVVGSGITLSKDGDIFATGVTTSTTFVGALTGNVTGNISGGTVAGSTGTFTGDVDIADKIVHTGDTDTAIRFSGADTVTVETGGTERFRIDSSGRVLIGTTTEGESTLDDLTIANSGDCGITIRSGTSSNGAIGFSDGTSGADEYRGIIDYDHNGDDLKFYTNATEKIRIDSSGRLLLGTTTEGNADADEFTIANTSGANMGMTIRSGTSALGQIFFSDGTSGAAEYAGMIQYGHNNNSLRFGTSGSEQIRIDTDGKLLVNHDSARSIAGGNSLIQVEANDSTGRISIVQNRNEAEEHLSYL